MNSQTIKNSIVFQYATENTIRPFLFITLLLCLPLMTFSQVVIQGYVYESGNRGYLEMAAISVLENDTKALRGEALTDENGKFEIALTAGKEYLIRINKKPFDPIEKVISTKDRTDGEKLFEKFEMRRLPGYVFEVTLAPSRADEDVVVDALTGAWIEVYNNTSDKEVLNLKNHPSHTFSCRFEQGNHYTILLRKDGFYNKRLEAYVNVKGCILCFDGVGEVKPGVSDVLTEGFEMGTLLANVEMQPVTLNKEIEIDNIFYDLGSARLKTAARAELDQLVILLKDNNNLLIEIGAHTDSRGDKKFNQDLSLRRAESVVKYLIDNGIAKQRMIPRGYGESKLRNRCADGVECSDRKHQKNRRTEFKVLGVVHEGLIDNQSLAEMKEVEKMEKLLAELGDSEIKIGEGETMPEDLRKQLEQSEKEAKNPKKNQSEPTAIKKEVESEVNNTEERVTFETADGPIEMKVTRKAKKENVNKPKPSSFDQTSKIDENNSITKKELQDEKPSMEPESIPNPVARRNNINKDKPFEYEEESFDQSAPEIAKEDQASGQKEIESDFVRAPKKLPNDYTGYKVQIVISTYELPLSHEIFSSHGNLLLEETKNGTYAYLLGSFKKKEDARIFMETILSRRYANARVVEYVEGRRIVR